MYQVSLPDSTQLLLQAKVNQAIPPFHGLRQEVYPSLFSARKKLPFHIISIIRPRPRIIQIWLSSS